MWQKCLMLLLVIIVAKVPNVFISTYSWVYLCILGKRSQRVFWDFFIIGGELYRCWAVKSIESEKWPKSTINLSIIILFFCFYKVSSASSDGPSRQFLSKDSNVAWLNFALIGVQMSFIEQVFNIIRNFIPSLGIIRSRCCFNIVSNNCRQGVCSFKQVVDLFTTFPIICFQFLTIIFAVTGEIDRRVY